MQLPEKKGKQNAAEEGQQQDPQLSETWRALLGLQPSDETGEQPQIDPSAQVQPLASR